MIRSVRRFHYLLTRVLGIYIVFDLESHGVGVNYPCAFTDDDDDQCSPSQPSPSKARYRLQAPPAPARFFGPCIRRNRVGQPHQHLALYQPTLSSRWIQLDDIHTRNHGVKHIRSGPVIIVKALCTAVSVPAILELVAISRCNHQRLDGALLQDHRKGRKGDARDSAVTNKFATFDFLMGSSF